MKLILEPLSRYNAMSFSSGQPFLDEYFKYRALEEAHSGAASVIVALSPDMPGKVLGYYTLTAASLDPEELPASPSILPLASGTIPAVLMERFALDSAQLGKGLGELLLVDALLRAYKAPLGWAVFLANAIHEGLKHFFHFFGFLPLTPNNSSLLWLTRREVHKLPGARTE